MELGTLSGNTLDTMFSTKLLTINQVLASDIMNNYFT